mmetsp:Transcript_24401/g.68570  ORF Transcript_24401/g.68570 Transcript_24401/m.68570 type:complete len:225 (-) Transcript_24401:8-682(-)
MVRATSVLVLCRVVLGAYNKAAALLGAAVDGLNDVDHLLLVGQRPVDLVVVARAQVDHDVLVAEEEHGRARVEQLVHGVEVGHLGDVHDVDDGELLDVLRDAREHLVHEHARLVRVAAEADDHHPLLLLHDCLVHRVPTLEMRQEVRHGARVQLVRTILRADEGQDYATGTPRRSTIAEPPAAWPSSSAVNLGQMRRLPGPNDFHAKCLARDAHRAVRSRRRWR